MNIEYNRCTELFELCSEGKSVLLEWDELLELSGYTLAMKEWKSVLDAGSDRIVEELQMSLIHAKEQRDAALLATSEAETRVGRAVEETDKSGYARGKDEACPNCVCYKAYNRERDKHPQKKVSKNV
jgi:hypothetical protein